MQLASIPTSVITANRQVLGSLQQASKLTQAAQASFEQDGIDAVKPSVLERALGHAEDARRGVSELGRTNVLDGTFQRYANHSVRELRDVVSMLERTAPLSKDGVKIFGEKLFDAEVSTRLGAEAGVRSLDRPALRGIERGSSSSDSGSSTSDGGPTWVDGEWIDSLGNPARGGDSWAGPDGERYGWDGSPSGNGGYVGPDGGSYSGI